MKFKVGASVWINDKEWIILQYRLGRGNEWIYTLSDTDEGSDNLMNLNSIALQRIIGDTTKCLNLQE